MSIKSGQRYKITNEQTKLAIDLDAGNHKTVMGYHSHGGENQQWVLDVQVNGQWFIRSADLQNLKYLGVENTSDNGTHLVGLDHPQFWDIDILPGCEDATKLNVKLCQTVHGTCFAVDFPQEKPPVGAGLQLWTAWGGKNQIWVLEECSSWFSRISISVKSGQRYKIINEETKMVADLSGGNHKSILGYTSHGGGNQQWITEKQVNGQWTIRSVDLNKYFGVEKTLDNGTQLLGLDKPQFWDIEVLPGSQASRLNVKICQWVNGTCFVVDYPLERLAVGTDFQVCAARGGRNQVWVLEEC